MPSKSKAQFGKMGQLYNEGKISKKTLEDFNKGVDPDSLPARAKPKSTEDLRKIHKMKYGKK